MGVAVHGFTVGPFAENAWLVADDETGDAVVVDPGFYDEADLRPLDALVREQGLTVRAIVGTHGHIDHVVGLHRVKARWDVPVYFHPGDADWLSAIVQQCALFGFPPVPEPQVDEWLSDGQVLQAGSLALEVIHTPGHTPGGCCLKVDDHLLTGDTLFAGSVGRTDFVGGDARALEQSIAGRLYPLGDDVQVHAGHGPDSTIGHERRTNPFVRG